MTNEHGSPRLEPNLGGRMAAADKKLSELTLLETIVRLFWWCMSCVLVLFAVLGVVLLVMGALSRLGLFSGVPEIDGHVARTSGEYMFVMLVFLSWAVLGISFLVKGPRKVLRSPIVRYRYLSAVLGVFVVMLACANGMHNRDLENMGAFALTVSASDAASGQELPANFDWPEGMPGTDIVRPQGSDAGASGVAKLWLANGPTRVKVTCPGYEDQVLTVGDKTDSHENMRTVKLRMRPLAARQSG